MCTYLKCPPTHFFMSLQPRFYGIVENSLNLDLFVHKAGNSTLIEVEWIEIGFWPTQIKISEKKTIWYGTGPHRLHSVGCSCTTCKKKKGFWSLGFTSTGQVRIHFCLFFSGSLVVERGPGQPPFTNNQAGPRAEAPSGGLSAAQQRQSTLAQLQLQVGISSFQNQECNELYVLFLLVSYTVPFI